jgi:hypothetical protein
VSEGATITTAWGWMAEFASPEELLAAAREVRAQGYEHPEAYTPFPVEGLAAVLGFERTRVPAATFCGALLGGAGGYFLQWYSAVVDFPINVGGRPLHSWPLFVPVTFEMAVLGGAFAAVVAMLAGSRLPKLRPPLFASPDFSLATRDRFFLCLRADDPGFRGDGARELLESLNPLRCVEVMR